MFKTLTSLFLFSAFMFDPALCGCLGGISVAVGTLSFCQLDNTSNGGGVYLANIFLPEISATICAGCPYMGFMAKSDSCDIADAKPQVTTLDQLCGLGWGGSVRT